MAIRKTRKIGGKRKRGGSNCDKGGKRRRRTKRRRRRRRGGSLGEVLRRAAGPFGLTYLATRKRRKRKGGKKRGGSPSSKGSDSKSRAYDYNCWYSCSPYLYVCRSGCLLTLYGLD